jgi:short-subunit dehydrogenase
VHFLHKTCVVIGASGGIGQELVAELRRRGARVLPILHSTSLSTKRKALSVDLGNPAAIRKVLSQIAAQVEKIDCLINASGIAAYKPFLSMTLKEIESVLTINLYGAIILTHGCIPLMRRHGFVVHMASMAGITPGHKFFAVYAASKEGLVGFLRAMTAEYPKLRFVAVTPAGVNTEIAVRAIGSKQLSIKFKNSKLESVEAVAKGILDQLGASRNDVRLFPTHKACHDYARLLN